MIQTRFGGTTLGRHKSPGERKRRASPPGSGSNHEHGAGTEQGTFTWLHLEATQHARVTQNSFVQQCMRQNSGYSILQAYTRINYSSPIGGFECHAEIYSSQVIIADKGMHDIQAFSLRSSYTPTGQGRNKLVGPIKPQALGSTTGIQGQRKVTILIVR